MHVIDITPPGAPHILFRLSTCVGLRVIAQTDKLFYNIAGKHGIHGTQVEHDIAERSPFYENVIHGPCLYKGMIPLRVPHFLAGLSTCICHRMIANTDIGSRDMIANYHFEHGMLVRSM